MRIPALQTSIPPCSDGVTTHCRNALKVVITFRAEKREEWWSPYLITKPVNDVWLWIFTYTCAGSRCITTRWAPRCRACWSTTPGPGCSRCCPGASTSPARRRSARRVCSRRWTTACTATWAGCSTSSWWTWTSSSSPTRSATRSNDVVSSLQIC